MDVDAEPRTWRVGHRGRDGMYYEELREGAWARLEIDGEMLTGRAHHVIYFASAEAWARYPAWAWGRRDEIVARIRTLIDNAKAAGTPVIWIQHEEGKPFTPGTEGWQIVEEIRPDEGETVIPKHYLDSFADTPLRKHLDDLGVGHL